MNNTTCNVSDKPSSFARGQRVAVEWENEGEALATIVSVQYWRNSVDMVVVYDDPRFERRADKWNGAYRSLTVNDPERWSARFKII